VWTFLFVEMFDSFGTVLGLISRCGFFGGIYVHICTVNLHNLKFMFETSGS
jgi:hypothetical protein